MKQPLSRRRCTILILLFLTADSLNTDLARGGPLGWLLCIAAAILAIPAGRIFLRGMLWLKETEKRTVQQLGGVFLFAFALWTFVRMVVDFGSFIRTYNDFALSPTVICLLMAATSFYLARLHGHGLARTAELLFWPIAAILVWTFFVGLRACDFGRLLPLRFSGSLMGLGWLFLRVFAQNLLVLALLCREAEPAPLRTAMRDSTLLTGLALGAFLAKDIAQAGWTLARGYTYPLYALAGLSRTGTGMHIEDLLICALLASRLIKGALLLRLMLGILKAASHNVTWTGKQDVSSP